MLSALEAVRTNVVGLWSARSGRDRSTAMSEMILPPNRNRNPLFPPSRERLPQFQLLRDTSATGSKKRRAVAKLSGAISHLVTEVQPGWKKFIAGLRRKGNCRNKFRDYTNAKKARRAKPARAGASGLVARICLLEAALNLPGIRQS
jgi:hypothetical protein